MAEKIPSLARRIPPAIAMCTVGPTGFVRRQHLLNMRKAYATTGLGVCDPRHRRCNPAAGPVEKMQMGAAVYSEASRRELGEGRLCGAEKCNGLSGYLARLRSRGESSRTGGCRSTVRRRMAGFVRSQRFGLCRSNDPMTMS